jgi:hypothetical protein
MLYLPAQFYLLSSKKSSLFVIILNADFARQPYFRFTTKN